MSEADLSFQNNLVRFKDKVDYIRKNPDYKSGEVMSVDSAIMHIIVLLMKDMDEQKLILLQY